MRRESTSMSGWITSSYDSSHTHTAVYLYFKALNFSSCPCVLYFFLPFRDINPHIPQYISSVPWYIDPSKRPTLKHQRPQEEKQKEFSAIGEWYKRGVQEVSSFLISSLNLLIYRLKIDTKKWTFWLQKSVSTKYRKGACENCGALTHKKKDCLEVTWVSLCCGNLFTEERHYRCLV